MGRHNLYLLNINNQEVETEAQAKMGKDDIHLLHQETSITLHALPCELLALEEAIVGYIQLVERTVPASPERSAVIAALRSFQQRYQVSLRKVQAPLKKRHRSGQESLIPVHATTREILAFATAVIGYIRLLKTTVAPSQERSDTIMRLITLQKRYIDSLPPA